MADIVTFITIERFQGDATAWDDFAERCGASFRGAYRAWTWQLDHHLPRQIKRFSCYTHIGNESVKIAQAAIGISPKMRVFTEGLMILPEFATLWQTTMAALLRTLSDGRYHYGSPWSLEPSREATFRDMGLSVTRVQPVTIYAVDLSRYATWDDYIKSIATNARRNMRKAEKANIIITSASGRASLRLAIPLIRLRKELFNRKSVTLSMSRYVMRFVLRILTMRRATFISIARDGERITAAFAGTLFGANTYYLESGAAKDNNGASWLLILTMIRRAYEHDPTGRFVIGFHLDGRPLNDGLTFFRNQCLSQLYTTSEVTFDYGRL